MNDLRDPNVQFRSWETGPDGHAWLHIEWECRHDPAKVRSSVKATPRRMAGHFVAQITRDCWQEMQQACPTCAAMAMPQIPDMASR